MTTTATTPATAPTELDADLVSDVTDILHDLDHEGCDHNACHGTPRSTYEAFARAFLPDVLDTVREALTGRLRDAAEETLADGGTHQDPLAHHLWDTCRRDATGAILDDPRNIAHAAYLFIADHLTEENR